MNRSCQVFKRASSGVAALALGVVSLGPSAALAGQPANVVQVVVPVTVTDASGRAVTGLAPEMFRANVDGAPEQTNSFMASHDLAAAIVFAPGVVKRWHDVREAAADAVRKSGGKAVVVFSRHEPASEGEAAPGVRFSGSKRRYRWPGDELAGMIARGLDAMESIAIKPGLRRAVFVVLDFPPEDLRHYRKSLLEQAAREDIQIFALWRSRERYSEYEGRSMLLLEELVERTGGRAARFSEAERIPSIVAQLASALRAAYELRLTVPSRRDESHIDIEVSLPKEDPRIHVSFRTRAKIESK